MYNQFKYRDLKKIAKSRQLSAFSYLRTVFKSAVSIFFTSSIDLHSCLKVSPSRYFKSDDKSIRYSNSEADPIAIFKYRANNGSLFIPQPSAILVGIDEDDRLICETSPYNSCLGNSLVTEYMAIVSAWDFSQTFNSLKSFIFKVNDFTADCRMLLAESLVLNNRPNSNSLLTKKLQSIENNQ